MCIFQYTTAVMFVFIVFFMIVVITLTAVPPPWRDVVLLAVVSESLSTHVALFLYLQYISEGCFFFFFIVV